MNKTISAIRMAVLCALGLLALILLFGEEQAETFGAFALLVIFDKSMAIAILCLVNRLYGRWFKRKTAQAE